MSLEVDIVTPARKLVEAHQVAHVKFPSARGELQILPGHQDLLTILETGVVSFQSDEGGNTTRWFAISKGFAEIRNDRGRLMEGNCLFRKLPKSLEVGRAILVVLLTVPYLGHQIRPLLVEDGLP